MEKEFNTNINTNLDTTHTIDLSDKLYKVMIGIIAIVGIFLATELLYQFSSLPQNTPDEIQVSGEGKAYAKPDIALVTFGVTTQAPKSQDAVNQNNEKMNALIKAVKDLGVDEKDIQTTFYNLTPVYDYPVIGAPSTGVGGSVGSSTIYPVPPRQTQVLRGYSLEQQILVKIRSFDKINTILDTATSKGATTVSQLQFTVDDPEKVRAKAREDAIKQAKEKAMVLARQSGLSLGKVINVSEGYSNYPMPYGVGGATLEKSATVAPDIQAGQMQITSNITITYRVR